MTEEFLVSFFYDVGKGRRIFGSINGAIPDQQTALEIRNDLNKLDRVYAQVTKRTMAIEDPNGHKEYKA